MATELVTSDTAARRRKRLFNLRLIPVLFAGMLITIPLCYALPPICAALLAGVFFLGIVFLCVFLWRKAFFKVLLCLLLGMTVACTSSAAHTLIYASRVVDIDSAYIEGRITDYSLCSPDGSIISSDGAAIYLSDIYADGKRIAGKCEIYLPERLASGLKVGDKIAFIGGIRSAEFDFTDSASVRSTRNRVYHRAYILSDNEALGIKETFSSQSGKPKLTERLRLRLRLVLESNCKGDTADFLYAMTFGDAKYLDSGVKATFRLTGTAHLLAVSGLHVGILSAAVIFLLKRLRLRAPIILAVNTALLAIYCFLCSFTPSVTRAAIMITIALSASALGLRRDALSSASLAGVILLTACPYALGDIGFLLSFAAVFGIILCSDKIRGALSKVMPARIASVLAISLSASAGTFPFMLLYFEGLSLSSTLANFLVVPLVSVIYPVYLLAAALCVIFPAAGVILPYICAPFNIIISVVASTASLPLLSLRASISKAVCALYFIALLMLSPYFNRGLIKRALSVAACAVTIIVLTAAFISYRPIKDGFACSDLGDTQYTAISSSGGNYLVISGAVDDYYLDDCRAFLSDRGMSSIDALILYDFSPEQLNSVQNYSKMLRCNKIYIAKGYTYYDNILSNVVIGDYISSDFSVTYPAAGVVAIASKGVRVVVADKGATIPSWFNGYEAIVW